MVDDRYRGSWWLVVVHYILSCLENEVDTFTRLISIVSKPILIVVVVVVIDVVFIKKMLGPS